MNPPRIAYLLKKFPRLSETFVLNEILAQEAQGRPLHVFSRRPPPDDEPRHPELRRLRSPVEVLPPRREIDPWQVLFADGGDPEALLARLGPVLRRARRWEHPRLPGLVAEALYLLERTAALGIRHVHTHFATDSAVAAMLLFELGGPSYSLTAHAKDIYRSSVRPELLERLFSRARFVVTVCDANVRYLEQRLSAAAMAPVRRLYNGIDLDSFAAPAARRREAAHILSVGRLVEKKGLHVLLEALARLAGGGRRFTATLVGHGEEREHLERRVGELGLGDRVRFAGALPQDRVRRLMAEATVFCLPCVVGADGNRDALPTVLLEALASGLPAVSTPVTGIPEILDGGRCGVLVPENDAPATARALQQLLDDPARRRRLARRGRRRAAELFDLRRSSRILHGWLGEALERRAVA